MKQKIKEKEGKTVPFTHPRMTEGKRSGPTFGFLKYCPL